MIKPDFQSRSAGALCVLDIETAPDPIAMAQAGIRGSRQEVAGILHQITDVSMLMAMEQDGGGWQDFQLTSLTAADGGEERLLLAVDRMMERLVCLEGTLVTFNGTRWDLPQLRTRAARHLMFDSPGLFPRSPLRHVDLMSETRLGGHGGRWSKLREAAGSLGIPTAHQLAGRGIGTSTAGQRKSQVDVLATFVLLLYELAALRQSPEPVIAGWRALAEFIAAMGPHDDHIAQFRRHALGGALEPR